MASTIISIATTSQLPRYSEIKNSDLIEVAIYDNSKYSDGTITYETLHDTLSTSVVNQISSEYTDQLSSIINEILLDDIKFEGQKTFTEVPKVNNDVMILSSQVRETITEVAPAFIKKDSTIDEFDLDFVELSSGETNTFELSATGNLMIYGWIANKDAIGQEQAYAALEGYINNEWKMLQVVPFYNGNIPDSLQYIAFNAHVANELSIRIRTGFEVSDTIFNNLKLNPKSLAESETTITCKFKGQLFKI